MVARLRTKPGGDPIPVTIGDFADVAVHGPYRLVFAVFNTFFNLLTQDAQILDESHVTLSKAGLRLEARWSGWNEEPFTARSERHVSVYRR